MFPISVTVYDIFPNQENCRNVDLKNEGQGREVEKRDLRHWTDNARILIGDFFTEF